MGHSDTLDTLQEPCHAVGPMRAHIFLLSILALGMNLGLACNFPDTQGHRDGPTVKPDPAPSPDPTPDPSPDTNLPPDSDPDPLPKPDPKPVKTPGPAACKTLPFVSQDDQIKLMADDIGDQRKEDREFTRYLTITYSSNAGACEGDKLELQRQRFALFKGINSVSTNPVVTKPVAIDKNETVYRIDIRDYDWDRELDLKGDGILTGLGTDAWDTIVATVGPFAVEYDGEDAASLTTDSETDVPFLPVNAFNHFTERDDLYYSLIGGKANLRDFEEDVLGVRIQDPEEQDNRLRAGFQNSGISKQDRAVDRFDQGTSNGYAYWISYDLAGNAEQDSIYLNPLGFASPAGESIFNLPNGMQGYYAALNDGRRLNQVDQNIVVDPSQPNGAVVNGASCHSCHNAGMITFTDTVRAFVVANSTLYPAKVVEDVLAQYPLPAAFKAVTDADSELHVRSVEKAGVPRGYPDAISRVFLDFQSAHVTSKTAAGELQVTEAELLRNLVKLDPKLLVLGDGGGHVDRGTFTATFLDAMCKLHENDDNPVLAAGGVPCLQVVVSDAGTSGTP